MQITNSRLCRFVTPSRGLGAAAILLAFFAGVQPAHATDGDLDPTFGSGGMVMADFNHSTDIASLGLAQ